MENNTFAGRGNLIQPRPEKDASPLEITATQNVFHLPPAKGSILAAGGVPPKEVVKHIRWHGRDNFYNLDRGNHFFHSGFEPAQRIPDLAAWQATWGEDERGGRHAQESRFQLDAFWQARTFAEQENLLQPIVEAHRRKLPNAGPNLDTIGPGDAYVRALAAAGKPVSKNELRPEAEDGGPIVLLRKGKAIRGYALLHQALEAVADGDIIELRTDKEIAGVIRDALPAGKSLTLRAGTGYRPVITEGGLFLSPRDSWAVEGLHIRGRLIGRITRLANCSFEPVPERAWADLVQFDGMGGAASLEIVHCSIPGGVRVHKLAKERTVRFVNSLLTNLSYGPGEKGDQRLELEHCLFWDPTSGRHALSSEVKETALAVQARGCIFETDKLLATPLGATRWTGSGNVYRVGNVTWAWEAKPEVTELEGWRKLWKSDADSIEAEPLRYDPRQWRLLPSSPAHGSAPGGKDFGADVERIGRVTPAARP